MSEEQINKFNILMLMGMTPQIITENIYSFAKIFPDLKPEAIHIIATKKGANVVTKSLLNEQTGKLLELCKIYNLTNYTKAIKKTHIHIINDGINDLEDIYSKEDNINAANFISNIVRMLTLDDQSPLYLSLAGGRKTMGFFAGYALSIYGRKCDKLFHTLVSREYEENPDFYFPINDIQERESNIELAEIPYIKLKYGISEKLSKKHKYADLIEDIQSEITKPQLIIDFNSRSLIIGDSLIKLPPLLFCFYLYFAIKCKQSCNFEVFYELDTNLLNLLYSKICKGLKINKTEISKNNLDSNFFLEKKSKINSTIKNIIKHNYCDFIIEKSGERPKTAYGINIDSKRIEIRGFDYE